MSDFDPQAPSGGGIVCSVDEDVSIHRAEDTGNSRGACLFSSSSLSKKTTMKERPIEVKCAIINMLYFSPCS